MSRLTHTHVLLFMLFCLLTAAMLRIINLEGIPAGVHYDEAANGILSAEIGRGESAPIFIESYTGKEVLFFYLAGGLMRLLGDSVFALRLTAVFVSLLTIAATYWLGTELFRDRRIAILSASLLVISFWHILFSRLGFRAISQPLLQTLTVAAFLHGFRVNKWRWFIFAGICLGLTGYTYLAARLFPILLLLGLLPILIQKNNWKSRWQQTIFMGVVALIILAPLLFYFFTHPDAFWVRITQVAVDETSLPLSESMLRSLQMFFLRGDPYVRFNIPERPLFDMVTGGFMVVGWFALAWRWHKLAHDWQKSGALIVLFAPLIMLLPTALATNEIVPSNLRAIGLAPFIFYLPAFGVWVFLQDLAQRYQRPNPTKAIWTISAVVLLLGGLTAFQLYFINWGTRNDVFLEVDGDLTAAASAIDALDADNTTVYVSALHYQHPTLAFLSDRYGEIKWLPNSEAFVFPAQGTAVYVYPYKSQPQNWTLDYLKQTEILDVGSTPNGEPAYTIYQLEEMPTVEPENQVNATFGNDITLLGYDILQEGHSGATMPLLLYWQAHLPQTEDFTPFVHLEDQGGHRWGQTQTFAYPGTQWARDDIIVQKVDVEVPSGTPPSNDYRLRVGLFSGNTGEQLLRVDENGRFAGDAYIIEDVPILASTPPEQIPQPSHALNRQIRPGLELVGYDRWATELSAGEPFDISLWWLADEIQTRLTTRIELQHQELATGYALSPQTPVQGQYPFESWQAPIFLIDHQSERIPENTQPGNYRVVLRIMGANDATIEQVDLGELVIKESERVYTKPATAVDTDVAFGNEIKLVGYDLDATETPNQYLLSLVWQALKEPTSDYTVFVHLLQQDGSCNPCVWQQDAMPQQNQYPTSRWLSDEYIVDSYPIVIPEGTETGAYPLEIGLYLAETGQRLQVLSPDAPENDVFYLRPFLIEE